MGTISYVVKVHAMDFITSESRSKQEADSILNNEIDIALAILPKGTTIVAKQEMQIVALSLDTMILFEHPLFQNGSRLDIERKRAAYQIGEGNSATVGQTSVISKVRYFDKDDKELFL